MFVKRYSLCHDCNSILINQSSNQTDFQTFKTTGGYMKAFALFNWRKNRHKVLSLLLKSLKGGGNKKVLKQLAEDLVLSKILALEDRNFDYIAYPPSKNGKSDHASVLAHEISKLINVPTYKFLHRIKSTDSGQKDKTALERQQINFSAAEKISCKNLLIIDDIVTTGSTIKAIHNAILPKHSVAVAIAFRRHEIT